MPAACVSRNPSGNNRQEREGRSVSPTRRETSSGQRVGKTTKKKDRETRREATLQRESKCVAQQRESPGGHHLADFAPLPSAVVKVARA